MAAHELGWRCMQVSLLFRYNSLTLLLEDGTTTVE